MYLLDFMLFLLCILLTHLPLLCYGSFLYSSGPLQAAWRPILKGNDEDLLLLAFSNVKFFEINGKIVCHSYRYTRNILTPKTATG